MQPRPYEDVYASFRWDAFLKERTGWEAGQPLSLARVAVDRFADEPERLAMIYVSPEGREERYTYGDFQVRTSQVAHVLRRLGVRKGDRVARLLPRRPENYTTFLGSWRAGAADVPLYTTFGSEAIGYRVKDSGARVLVTDAINREKLERIPGGLPGVQVVVVGEAADLRPGDLSFWEECWAAPEFFEVEETQETDLAVLQYTSGTTGPPKGAMITHAGILGLFPYGKHYLDLRPGELFWTVADPGWAYGLLTAGACVMGAGSPILLYGGAFDAETWYQLMERYQVRNFSAAPTAFRTIAAAGDDLPGRYHLQARRLTSAGEYLNPEVSRWFRERLGVPIWDQYGVTETGMVLGNHVTMPEKPGSMGKAVPGFEVAVMDLEGREVPPGASGVVAVRRNRFLLAQGYWNNPQGWEQRFLAGEWFNTSDMASRDEEGYFFYKGREDDVISSAGYRIGPAEIEDCLLEHPALAEAAVVGKPDSQRGEVVVAHVVLRAGHEATEELGRELQEWVRQRYSKHAYPREVVFATELPKTESGKIMRRALR